MYSFQAKIGFKKMRKGENKNYRYGFVSSENMFEKAEKEKK